MNRNKFHVDKIKFFSIIIFVSILSGCGAEEVTGDSVVDVNTQPISITAQDSTSFSGFSQTYEVDLSSKVFTSDGSGFTVTDVEILSNTDECEVQRLTGTGFVIESMHTKVCDYRYYVAPLQTSVQANSQPSVQAYSQSVSSSTSAISRVAVSSASTEEALTPISATTLINIDVSINIEDELAKVGYVLTNDFILNDVILAYPNPGTAVEDPANDRIINYTPALNATGIDRILYSYIDSINDIVLMGTIDIAVGYETNKGFVIKDGAAFSDLVEVNTITEIDISQFVESSDGDDYQLVSVDAFNATVNLKSPLDMSNKIITFEANKAAFYYVSFAVSDHNGAYDIGLFSVEVIDPNQSARWKDISLGLDVFTQPPTAADAVAKGLIYDATVEDLGFSPGVVMAKFRLPNAIGYCDSVDAILPTPEELKALSTDVNVQVMHTWPVDANYVAYDESSGDVEWVNLTDNVNSNGIITGADTYYVTCIKQGLVEVLPVSDEWAVADSIDEANVEVKIELGGKAIEGAIVSADTNSNNVTLSTQTVTTGVDGIAAFSLTTLKAETVILTLSYQGFDTNHEIKFIGDEKTATVTSEVTVDLASYHSVEGNQVMATLIDENDNPIENSLVDFAVSSEIDSDTLLSVTPILAIQSAQTDVNGEQRVNIKWDPNNTIPAYNMTFDVTSSYMTSTNQLSTEIEKVTFNAYTCGGVVNDTDKSNVAGECVKVSSYDGQTLYTGSPSVAFLKRVNYSAYENISTERGFDFALFDAEAGQIVELCDLYNQLNISQRANWLPATSEQLADMSISNGNMFQGFGWVVQDYYMTTTMSGSNYRAHSMSYDTSNYVLLKEYRESYASCVSI